LRCTAEGLYALLDAGRAEHLLKELEELALLELPRLVTLHGGAHSCDDGLVELERRILEELAVEIIKVDAQACALGCTGRSTTHI